MEARKPNKLKKYFHSDFGNCDTKYRSSQHNKELSRNKKSFLQSSLSIQKFQFKQELFQKRYLTKKLHFRIH